MEPLPGIPHGDLLKLVFSFAVLLATARGFAELARRVRLPEVIGEIFAGVLLGPSMLSGLFPDFGRLILPENELQAQLLDVLGLLGIMFLLITVGLETDLALIRTRLRTAVGVGLGGLVVPFLAGLALSFAFPDDLLVDPDRRRVFALFIAVALALSAIPVLAKILIDLGMMRSRFGQVALAAGMIDDIVGWTLLGMVTSLAAAGGVSLANAVGTLGSVALFVVATVLVARPVAKWSLRLAQERIKGRDMVLTLVVVLGFVWGAFSHALHLEPILGAFAIGVIFGQMRRFPVDTGRRLESVTYGVFAPVFLATAGLRLSVDSLLEPDLLALTGLMVGVAAAGKLIGTYVGARYVAAAGRREAIGYGIALNARGVLGIIVAAIGLSMGILGIEVYSMIVVTSVVTSLVAPLGLRLIFRKELGGEVDVDDSLAAISRVLLPVRVRQGSPTEVAVTGVTGRHADRAEPSVQALEASVLASLAAGMPGVTLFTVAGRRERRSADRYLTELSGLFAPGTDVTRKVARGDPTTAIIEEANRGYDLIAMGAPEAPRGGDHLFGSVVDEVVRLAPCPSLVFTARRGHWPPRWIMVPTSGTEPSARAADLAFAVAGPETPVLIFHVIENDLSTEMSTSRAGSLTVRMDIAEGIVNELRDVGSRRGIRVQTEVVMSDSMVGSLVDRARRNIDLIILGTGVRAGSRRLFLGPRVERLLTEAPCSVLVLNV